MQEVFKSSTSLLEGVFRLYDLMQRAEEEDHNEGRKSATASRAKNKLIFFAAFVRDCWTDFGERLGAEIAGKVRKEEAEEKQMKAMHDMAERKKKEGVIIDSKGDPYNMVD